jgi:hypothetical protein
MALVIADRVKETSTTTGTGTFTLGGAVTGFQPFSVIGNGNQCYYTIVGIAVGAEWEVGVGTYSSSTITRDTVLDSSAGGAKVSFSAGTKEVFVTYPAKKAVLLDANNSLFPANDLPAIISTNSSSDALRITQVGSGNALVVEDSANPDATPFVIDNAGQVISGHTAYIPTVVSLGGGVASVITTSGQIGFTTNRFQDDTTDIKFVFNKARGSVTAPTIVANNDGLGTTWFAGYDGAGYVRGALISAFVDGTPGTNDMPGRLVFSTTADGASSPTERMRITSAGNVGIGTTSPQEELHVNRAAATAGILVTRTTVSPSYLGLLAAGGTASLIGGPQMRFYTAAADGTSTTERMRIDSSGNVGIGTSSPGAKLEISADPDPIALALKGRSSDGIASLIFTDNSGSELVSFSSRGNGELRSNAENGFFTWRTGTGLPERMRINSTGTISLGAAPGAESLRVTPVASAVNYWALNGNVTGSAPALLVNGSDTNISAFHVTKGTGNFGFYTGTTSGLTGAVQQFRISHTASAVNYLQVTGDSGDFPKLSAQGSSTNVAMVYITKGNQSHIFQTSGGTNQFIVAHTASAVNYLQVAGGAASNAPVLTTQGSDANIFMVLSTKGTGSYLFATNNLTSTQFSVAHTASAVNYLTATGGATGNSAKLNASGSDTNIDLALTPKGTGVLSFGTYTAGILAQAGYITIKDAAGNTRNLLVG